MKSFLRILKILTVIFWGGMAAIFSIMLAYVPIHGAAPTELMNTPIYIICIIIFMAVLSIVPYRYLVNNKFIFYTCIGISSFPAFEILFHSSLSLKDLCKDPGWLLLYAPIELLFIAAIFGLPLSITLAGFVLKPEKYRLSPKAKWILSALASIVVLYWLVFVRVSECVTNKLEILSPKEQKAFIQRAIPLIEETTGRKFTDPVFVRVGTNEELDILTKHAFGYLQELEKKDDLHRNQYFTFAGYYDSNNKQILIFPQVFWSVEGFNQRKQRVYRNIVHELTHALDDQYGLFRPRHVVKQLLADGKLAQFCIIRALEEGHAEFVADCVCQRLGIGKTEQDLAALAALDSSRFSWDRKSDFETQYLKELLHFVYEESDVFFHVLQKAGQRELVEYILRNPPPCCHHIRYPELYLSDKLNGRLPFFENLISQLETPPQGYAWKLKMDASSVPDIEFKTIELMDDKNDKETNEWRDIQNGCIAHWACGFQHTTVNGIWLNIFVYRYRTPVLAERHVKYTIDELKGKIIDMKELKLKTERTDYKWVVRECQDKWRCEALAAVSDCYFHVWATKPLSQTEISIEKDTRMLFERIVTAYDLACISNNLLRE